MAKELKLNKLIGTSKQDFDACISNGLVTLRRARLIPVAKPGDEIALASVILSALKLVYEFRKLMFTQKLPSLNFLIVESMDLY
jgi:hypothetical protein